MGLFSSLFGSAGSDKADKMRQAAIDAFGSVQTPELSALQVQLNNYVNAGKITPEEAEATLLNSNAFNAIKEDPEATGAQKQALQQLQDISGKGGLTAIDKAQIQDITDTLNQEANSRNAAMMTNAQERGIGGSGLELANRMSNEQGAANRASRAGTDVAANAQARALAALTAQGQLGGQIESQQYGEQANKAAAQNAIDKFNAETQTSTNATNVNTANQAQAANLANEQAIQNANTSTQNANKQYNAQQNQTVYEDQLKKAQGIAGVYGGWANDASTASKAEKAGDVGLVSGLLNTGAQALAWGMGGPAAGMAVSGMANSKNKTQYAEGGEVVKDNKVEIPKKEFIEEHERLIPQLEGHEKEMQLNELEDIKSGALEDEYSDFVSKYCHGGSVNMADGGSIHIKPSHEGLLHKNLGVPQGNPIPEKKLSHALNSDSGAVRKRAQFAENAKHWHHAEGGEIKDYRDGGNVSGVPNVPGDSEKNDVVSAKLSPGEVVLPRTVVQQPEKIVPFVEKSVKPTEEDFKTRALKLLQSQGRK